MSSTNSGYSATDIITYIGVPLAVLGVLPILYNTVATLAALSKIKRMLRHGRLTALTRSDVVNRVIEVELPRYAVTPCDRFAETELYWKPARQPSSIPGGSWTTFNWQARAIGAKTQRVEYADQLRQPQVDVAFDQLVAYLLDLGAVPEAHGWKLLRSTGLWTPTGCSLMKSPDGYHDALTIAPLDDSDGHLSLKAKWSLDWTTRDFSSLPPYWIRLPPPPIIEPTEITEPVEPSEGTSTSPEGPQVEDVEKGVEEKEKSSVRKKSLDSVQKQAEKNASATITCQISVEGLISAMSQEDSANFSSADMQSLYIEHLRVRASKNDGVWFASIATAYGTTSQTVLWNYKIPDDILNFARRDTVPCGILAVLDVVDDSQTPEWTTSYDAAEEERELFFRRSNERHEALMSESRMQPAQREAAVRDRMYREMNQRMQDMRDRQRRDYQRREARMSEALQSPKWDTKLVSEHYLRWLRERKEPSTVGVNIDASLTVRDIVGMLLHRMVLDGEFASSICKILDLWKAWADNGGMRRSDLDTLREKQELFALASLLVALVRDTVTAHEGTLSIDLQECLRIWKTVRLG
ncbi:uncharacterized protein F4807DRAFT_138717 [Annulohypoxylon truncatum]|uniref:uncharacterized protein n=1 Tax=Annulohypoxylon truncatum TaxID=327061 RepID=UPI002007C8AF|nr:uncharacterized protein F4807DRAFT_138717 [Annulohypoxylon truncatum]KAI1208548.1 hypothetical protein F4807DRAFT_138717 [Annulohypoxylon truncatum]